MFHRINDVSLVHIAIYSSAHVERIRQRWEDNIKMNLKVCVGIGVCTKYGSRYGLEANSYKHCSTQSCSKGAGGWGVGRIQNSQRVLASQARILSMGLQM